MQEERETEKPGRGAHVHQCFGCLSYLTVHMLWAMLKLRGQDDGNRSERASERDRARTRERERVKRREREREGCNVPKPDDHDNGNQPSYVLP